MSWLVLASAVLWAFQAGWAGGNIGPNPSAERVDERGRPVGWGHYENTPALWGATEEEFYTGKRCAFLKITGFGDDGYACTGLAVGETDGYTAPNGMPVKPNTTYHFSFYIAGYGFKRKITVHPWGFDKAGKNRDRGIRGISLIPTPEWKYYKGTFTTKAGTQRIALMFFVYGLQGRDVEEGATIFVDDVYVGEEEPPASFSPQGKKKVTVPKKLSAKDRLPYLREEGYQPYEGKVRLWDLGKAYGRGVSMSFVGWKDRTKWSQIPYGKTPDDVREDVALEGPTFFLNITWRPDPYISGPVLYRKPKPSDPHPPRHNLLYRGWLTPGGLWAGGANLGYIKVLKNTPDQIIVQSAGRKSYRDKRAVAQVVANYVVRRGKPWLEVIPVRQCSMIGMHGETRIVIFPEAGRDGGDFLYDALLDAEKDKIFNRLTGLPTGFRARMLLDYVMDDDNLWVLMPTPTAPNSDEDSNRMAMEYRTCRFMLSNQVGGYHAGWSLMGEEKCTRVVSAPYAFFLGRKVVIGHLRPGYWHYQRLGRRVEENQLVSLKWRVAYQRKWADSPFEPGGKWRPLYPGRWRLISRIDGRYYTISLDIAKEQTMSSSFSFKSPASGKLEYVVFYLYDRTDETPKNIWTPMDIYREAIKKRAEQ